MDLTLTNDQTASLTIEALDADGNPTNLAGYTPSVSNSNPSIASATIDSNGMLDIVPTGTSTGSSTIVVSTTFGSTTLNLTVSGPSNPPTSINLLLAIKAYTTNGSGGATRGS